ncbi:amino acid aminotransferase [Novosphingobium sp.]|uniref:amino acid aminotransferase n=1 Tax=Novosphingobium sp. TaxID=1874826 RepID=UPI0028A7E3A2|nr:amino acid aminotransferase [Novosphingobium sp.]
MTDHALLDAAPVPASVLGRGTATLQNAFAGLLEQPADGLLGLIALHRADPRPEKIDLGVGVFRNDAGATPVMRAVKEAEEILLGSQDTKSYLGAEGDVAYAELLAEIALGRALAGSERIVGVQTPGGTGALRLGAELLARARPQASVWIGNPTWPNHAPIFAEAGLSVKTHRFYDVARATIDFDGMVHDLAQAAPGDILLLHGCCHNPTGAALSNEEWQAIASLCADRGLIAFVDLAYQGLGDGLEEDAQATRMLFEALPAVILAYSCDKNFGLYRERVGALWVQAPGTQVAATVRGNMLSLARGIWSMPPDHGAAVVRTILEHPELRADWARELDEMRHRINLLRQTVAAQDSRLGFIARQRGMFAMLPVDGVAVAAMRRDNGIYMAGNGRINIAGLTAQNVPLFVAGLAPHI